ncbi:hypothetical protein NDU88_005490 [Pleurodeles waltl]|uniref:Uncharacterized protein n=1 Tax=Pleurodeles waltl TaxID=8319 RepID=A0AAV7PJQ5_PLEWA|nr:hypothetical protein NDU88_005490 [Pleurodeles waltl]
MTPNLDPEIITYLFKLGKDQRKGLEKSLNQCQDKVLDILGPLAKIFDTVEEAYLKEKVIDLHLLLGWCQRAIYFLGNDDAGLLAERRKTVLMCISPKLSELANKESPEEACGLLFGEGMIKSLTKYVRTFPGLDKAYFSMHRVFSNVSFYGRASKRGQLTGWAGFRPQYQTNEMYLTEEAKEDLSFTPNGGEVEVVTPDQGVRPLEELKTTVATLRGFIFVSVRSWAFCGYVLVYSVEFVEELGCLCASVGEYSKLRLNCLAGLTVSDDAGLKAFPSGVLAAWGRVRQQGEGGVPWALRPSAREPADVLLRSVRPGLPYLSVVA